MARAGIFGHRHQAVRRELGGLCARLGKSTMAEGIKPPAIALEQACQEPEARRKLPLMRIPALSYSCGYAGNCSRCTAIKPFFLDWRTAGKLVGLSHPEAAGG